MDYFNYIEEYCENQLDVSMKPAFEKAMAKDVRLKAAVSQYEDGKKIAEGLLEMDIMETIAKLEVGSREFEVGSGELNANSSIRHMNKPHVFTLKRILVAASLTGIILLLGWLVMKDNSINTNDLYANLYEEPIWPTERSSSSDVLSMAVNEYLGGNFEVAKHLLLDSLENKILGRFWLAEMYMKDGQLDSVLHYLPSSNDLQGEQSRILLLKTLLNNKKNR